MNKEETTDKTNEINLEASLLEEANISPELIREIADRVYLLLIQRLQIEQERSRTFSYDN